MNAADALRILVVDDHVLFRKGLGLLMSSRNDMKIVGEAENGQDAISMARSTHPDLILMDVHMPGCDGIQAMSAIKKEMPDMKIVMLSASDDDDDLFAAIKSGADGYLLKDIDPAKFFKLIQNVHNGEAPISGILPIASLKNSENGVRIKIFRIRTWSI
jgi:DNA-binding NarL/FixJ family response regulator